ncbi:TetR/AcrR family transcriptional regulator [Paenibacillus sp. TY11]|uniref:TetR/AcrR family transcriptional regulator n=1 Tax=Paenibacillus sp. TY11 TaxID=3448633 RepID=UPI0040392E77
METLKGSEIWLPQNNLFDEIIAYAKESSLKQSAKQKKILEVAIGMFAKKGYSNTSTAEIAKLAEVSEGTIFKHYGTKDKLLFSIIFPFIKSALPSLADEVFREIFTEKTATFKDFLMAFFKNRTQFIMENRQIFQVVVKELIYREELRNELLPLFQENITPRINRVVDYFKAQGELIQLPNEMILKALFTFFGGFFISNFVWLNRSAVSNDEIEAAVQFVMHGLTNSNEGSE